MDFNMDPTFWLKFQKAMKVWEDNFPWNTRILKMTFLYPFQNKIVQIFGNLTILSCLLILLVTTILKLIKDIKNEIKYSTMVEIIFQLVAFGMIIFCYMFMISSKNKIYKGIVLMTRLWLACDEVQEMKIKYGRIGYILTNLQAGSILLSLIGFVTAPVAIPSFLTWVLPGNRTQEKTLPLHTEFFLDEDEYFYHIFAAQFVLIFVYSLIIVSMVHFQLSAISFIMCEIWFYRYRLEGMSNAYNWKRAINEKNANKWICEQLKDLVRCHEICIEYYWILQKNCDPLMFVILSCCSCMVVLTGTSMVMLVETDLTGATKMLIVFGLTLFAIIFICIPSQLLKNASEDFYITSCIMNGQIHSPKIRKMLLLIMMRTMKPFVLTAGSTIELNLETCSTIIKSSLSYIAALRSVYKSL